MSGLSWPVYAILCAFFTATADVFSKIGMRKTDVYAIGWLRIILAVPFLFLLLFLFKIPEINGLFWGVIFLLLPLELTAYILYLKAIKISDLSITLPFLALTPMFAMVTSFIMLGEKLKFLGVAGIFLVGIGAYFLNIDRAGEGILQPFKKACKETGPRFMIIVAFIYSITSNLGKFAILHSSPTFFPVIHFSLVGFTLTPLVWIRYNNRKKAQIIWSKEQVPLYLLMGLIFALAIFTHCLAISQANVAYMISVKRMSLLFGVAYGGLVFREKNIKNRFTGALFMLFGAILITLA